MTIDAAPRSSAGWPRAAPQAPDQLPRGVVHSTTVTSTVSVTTVMLVDDHTMFVETLRDALQLVDSLDIVAIADSVATAVTEVSVRRPEVVVLDYRLPGMSGAELVAAIREASPDSKILMLSAAASERAVVDAIRAGCAGYITKDRRLDDVITAIESVQRGELYVPPDLLAKVLPRLNRRGAPKWQLSDREVEVLEMLALGRSSAEIAEELVLSLHTVRNHIQRILRKLGAHNRLEAVARAKQAGLIEPAI